MSIGALVTLYRMVGRPALSSGAFSGAIVAEDCRELIKDIVKSRSGQFIDFTVDKNDLPPTGDIPDGSKVYFNVRPEARSSSRFYNNISDFLKQDKKIGRGEMPSGFYLVEEDYFDDGIESNVSVSRLANVCELISCLSKLAHYHDEKAKTRFLRLVFLKPEEIGNTHPVVVETFVDEDLLKASGEIPTDRLKYLCESSEAEDPHYRERLGVFGNTMAEFIQARPESEKPFYYLVKSWSSFLEVYDKNLAVYLSGFAFHKAKREVAEAEVSISSKLSQVIGDITGKLLGIPVSFAAVIAIPKAGGVFESTLIVLGLLVATFVIVEVIENQKRQLSRVTDSKNLVLSAFQGRKDIYPTDLSDAVDRITTNLGNDGEKLERLLCFFRVLAWIPVLLALVVHVSLFSNYI